MFSGSTVVNIEHLRDGGYETRLAAQTVLFQRTRLLYDLDYELDPLVIIQSLLLMTLRSGNQGEEKDAWHWVGVAVSLAYAIGLNKIPPAARQVSPEFKLKKRVWWCCLVRGQLVALETNRSSHIRPIDWRTTTLTIDDFEFRHLPKKVIDFYSDCGMMKSPNLQHELATIFTAEAGLCTITSRLTQASSVFKHASKPDIRDLKIPPDISELDSVDGELLDWAQSLPSCCDIRDVTPAGVGEDKLVIATRRSILHMLYYATSCIVHRMRHLSSIASVDLKSSVRAPTTSQLRVREAVLHITRIIDDLDRHGLISSLPATERTIICSAISMSMQVMD
ncbi:hypothetical protein FDECE_10959 [Fusarium decemcellulare]|nr:hypothetical protein FDECE_10959 [Fusarium decemcellulare]